MCTTRTLHIWSGLVGGATYKGISPISFLAPYEFTHPLTRTHVRLLGPCFKTGRMGSPQADAGSTHVPRHAMRHALWFTIATMMSPRAFQQPALGPPSQSASINASSRSAARLSSFHIRPRHIAGPHPLPSRKFQALFDSLFKVLFFFPSRYSFGDICRPFQPSHLKNHEFHFFLKHPTKHSSNIVVHRPTRPCAKPTELKIFVHQDFHGIHLGTFVGHFNPHISKPRFSFFHKTTYQAI